MIILLVILTSVLIPNESAKILAMYPTPSVSHQVVFRPLMLELAKRGHEVTVITTDPIQVDEENFTQIDVHDLSYEYWRKKVVPTIDGESKSSFKLLEAVMHGMVSIVEEQMKTEDVKDLLNSGKKFDLIFVVAFVKPRLILSHIFKAPVIQFSSLSSFYPMSDIIGAPSHPVYYPEVLRKKLYKLSFWDKIEALYDELSFRNLISNVKNEEDGMLKRVFGVRAPSIDELTNNVDMLFLNVHPIWDDNRPMPPAVIYTGGLHQKPPKPLPDDLESFLDNSVHGVIYMSFGSNVDPTVLAAARVQVFCAVFSRLRYDVLWKWNGDELPGRPGNVRISKWFPQADLLRHPKIKLFITQAGLQSTDEAISAGVPLIAFPMLGDQWYNAEKYEKHGIGVQMDFETVTEGELEKTIINVIEDKSFQANIVRLGALMRDQPESPLSRAVWWTEHVLRHRGARHYRAPLANATWGDFLIIDVLLVLLGSVLMSLIAVVFAVKFLLVFQREEVKLKNN